MEPVGADDVIVRRCTMDEKWLGDGAPIECDADAPRGFWRATQRDALFAYPADVISVCVAFKHRQVRHRLKAYHKAESSEWSERED